MFELFRSALDHGVDDFEIYRELLWSNNLLPDEALFFAKKLTEVHEEMGYDVYMWLANVFELQSSDADSAERSFQCLKKAARYNPRSDRPYLSACELYDGDLNVPSVKSILAFLKSGSTKVKNPRSIYGRLSAFYRMLGNEEMYRYFKGKSGR